MSLQVIAKSLIIILLVWILNVWKGHDCLIIAQKTWTNNQIATIKALIVWCYDPEISISLLQKKSSEVVVSNSIEGINLKKINLNIKTILSLFLVYSCWINYRDCCVS
jgi:hypothetical protein